MTYLEAVQALWTRATGIVDGVDAELKVSLPTVRGWVTLEKKPRVVWEEFAYVRSFGCEVWVVRPLDRIEWRAAEKAREVVNTRGWSQVPGVVAIRFTFDEGLVITKRDGTVIHHVD